MNYPRNLATAIDQLLNALLGGYCDESLSARAYRWRRDGKRQWAAQAINALFFWQKDHVFSAYGNEQARRQLPPEYRTGKEQE
jgi:hypothetical protein